MRRVGNAPVGAIIYANSYVWKFLSIRGDRARCRLLAGDYGEPIGYEGDFYYSDDISRWPWSKGIIKQVINKCQENTNITTPA